MRWVEILTKSIVADYCNYCNRHQEKTMPAAVFLFSKHSYAWEEMPGQPI